MHGHIQKENVPWLGMRTSIGVGAHGGKRLADRFQVCICIQKFSIIALTFTILPIKELFEQGDVIHRLTNLRF